MVEIKTDFQTYRFYHHVNVIVGSGVDAYDSGVGKSYLFNELKRQMIEGHLMSNVEVCLIDSPNLFGVEALNNITNNTCVILDEANFAPGWLNNMLERVRSAKAYVIVIGRLLMKQLEYSVDAIYEVDRRNLELTRKFTSKDTNTVIFDAVVTEDSASVAFLYELLIYKEDLELLIYTEDLKTEVIPALGRSRFFEHIKNNKSPLLIADKAKFGSELLLLLGKIGDCCNMNTLSLFLPESFEEIVLDILDCEYKVSDYEAFDNEALFEIILEQNVSWWNKKGLAKSINYLIDNFDIMDSNILRKLVNVFKGVGCECFYQITILSESDRQILKMIPESVKSKYKSEAEAIEAFKAYI